MRSFLKLFGPDLEKSMDMLQKVSKDFNELSGTTSLRNYTDLKKGHSQIKSDPMIGNYDFVFDWHEEPKLERVIELINLIDKNLLSLRAKYQIFTLEHFNSEPLEIQTDYYVAYVKFTGPGIFSALEAMKQVSYQKIRRSGATEGYTDFFFEFSDPPTYQDSLNLIERIEEILPSEYPKLMYNYILKAPTLDARYLQEAQLLIYSQMPFY